MAGSNNRLTHSDELRRIEQDPSRVAWAEQDLADITRSPYARHSRIALDQRTAQRLGEAGLVVTTYLREVGTDLDEIRRMRAVTEAAELLLEALDGDAPFEVDEGELTEYRTIDGEPMQLLRGSPSAAMSDKLEAATEKLRAAMYPDKHE